MYRDFIDHIMMLTEAVMGGDELTARAEASWVNEHIDDWEHNNCSCEGLEADY